MSEMIVDGDKLLLPCSTIHDLLPAYICHRTSKTTCSAIDSHLASCNSCRELYEDMISFLDNVDTVNEDNAANKLTSSGDFLRKDIRANISLLIGSAFITLMIIGIIIYVYLIR